MFKSYVSLFLVLLSSSAYANSIAECKYIASGQVDGIFFIAFRCIDEKEVCDFLIKGKQMQKSCKALTNSN